MGYTYQTLHPVSLVEGYVKIDQSQQERFLTVKLVSPGQFSLKQTSEVKMLSVCQLYHTPIISFYTTVYHVKPLAFKYFVHLKSVGITFPNQEKCDLNKAR